MTRRPAAILSLALLASVPAAAIYVRMETRQVPVERLVGNLERELAKDPKNVATLINLARLHGMAFALKTEEAPVANLKGQEAGAERPWYGREPRHVPYDVRPATTPEQDAAAREHLERSLDYYTRALELDADSLLARLGHAWALEQSGDKAAAIAEYRQVIERAWASEQKATRAGLGERFYTEEAAGYLVKLLDPVTDAAEVRELEARREKLRRLPRPITPIAVPLRDDVPATSIADPLARVTFDADGSGLRREWSWISRDAGWLVYDADGSGRITSALQWFGNVTFWLFWTHGYEALSALDDDGDGELAGEELRHLAIWQDRDGDGVSDDGEVLPLGAHGIVAMSCGFVTGDGRAFAAWSEQGVRLANGRTRPTYDVILRSSAQRLTLLRRPRKSPILE
jgi:tetratricopeptide (TPR) repeat protein